VSGWDWLAVAVALLAVSAAIGYAVQSSLVEAFQKGYKQGHEEGFSKGVFEASHGVRAHSTENPQSTVRTAHKKAEGDEKKGPSA